MTEIANIDRAASTAAGAVPLATDHLDLIHREAEAGAIVDLLLAGDRDAALDATLYLQENLRRELAGLGVQTRRAWDDLNHQDKRVAAHALQATKYATTDAAGEKQADRRAAADALRSYEVAARLRTATAVERAAARGLWVVACDRGRSDLGPTGPA
jgi:hypothetical protein